MSQIPQNEVETWHEKRVEDWSQQDVIAWISSLGPSLKTLKPKFIDVDGSKLLEMSLNDKIPQPMLRKLFKKQLDKIQKQNESFSKNAAQNEKNAMKMSWQNTPMNKWTPQMVEDFICKTYEPTPIPQQALANIFKKVKTDGITGANLRNADNHIALRDLLGDSVAMFKNHQLEDFKDKVNERIQEEIENGIGCDDFEQKELKDEPFDICIYAVGSIKRIKVSKYYTIKDVAGIYQDEVGGDHRKFQFIVNGRMYAADHKYRMEEIGVTENTVLTLAVKSPSKALKLGNGADYSYVKGINKVLQECPLIPITYLKDQGGKAPQFRACPGCSLLIEHENDCTLKHMHCINKDCEASFCFICLAVADGYGYNVKWPKSCGEIAGYANLCELAPRQFLK